MLKRLLALALVAAVLPSRAAPPHHAVIETSLGEILVELETDRAPRSVAAFAAFARAGQYDGTVMHRVVKGFVAQGGEIAAGEGTAPGLPVPPKAQVPAFAPEVATGLSNRRGTIAFHRTQADFPELAPHGFFLNLDDNDFLDHRRFDRGAIVPTPSGPQAVPAGTEIPGHAVFGRVVKGLDVLERIAAVPVRAEAPHGHWPVALVVVKRVRILSAPR